MNSLERIKQIRKNIQSIYVSIYKRNLDILMDVQDFFNQQKENQKCYT